MDDEIRFHIEQDGRVTGPVTDDEVRSRLRDGSLGKPGEEQACRVRLAGTDLWASPRAFATFGRAPGGGSEKPPAGPVPGAGVLAELPAELAAAPRSLRDVLLFWIHEGEMTFGPLTGAQLRGDLAAGYHQKATCSLVDSGAWYPVALIAGTASAAEVARASSYFVPPARDSAPGASSAPGTVRPSTAGTGSLRRPPTAIYLGAAAKPDGSTIVVESAPSRCPICLERVPITAVTCPECQEPFAVAGPPSVPGPQSIPDDPPGASWLTMHWRPLVTIGTMTAVVCFGVALRYLAPGRFMPVKPNSRAATASGPSAAGCSAGCWGGEACQMGKCVWQAPNDAHHVAAANQPTVSGPFALPKDVSDALPLDGERFAVSLLSGLQIVNARTGGVLGMVTDAPQSRRLYRVGPVVYSSAPQRIYVIDATTTKILKTIETGSPVSELVLGAAGRRAFASLSYQHAVAVLATEYHAEIDRIQFGDDAVGPLGADDTGKRALVTNGQVPLPGLGEPKGGAVYAFDPSRLASAQDRVRASMVGNPVSVLMAPDGQASYVVLRAEDALVPLEWLPSGAVRQEARIGTCREPEQIELVRRGRLGVVRCNEGRAIEIFDLQKRELVRHVPFNARVADLAVAPDGKQAIVALPAEGAGFIGIVDLETYGVRVLPVTAEPTRVRLSPDGSMALVLSDRAKVAWVIR